jgi:hypothetical protein
MKQTLLSIIFFVSLCCAAQDKHEELYILFDHGKGQEKFFNTTVNGLAKNNPIYTLMFGSQYIYLAFNAVPSDNLEVRNEKKNFLRNSNVIKAADLVKVGLDKSIEMVSGKKLYIIDVDEIQRNTIIVRQVNSHSSKPMEM